MRTISIGEVLDRIGLSSNDVDGYLPFSIEYTRADGSIGFKGRVLAYRKRFLRGKGKGSDGESMGMPTNLKDNGLILLVDLDSQDKGVFWLFYPMMRKYNDIRIHFE